MERTLLANPLLDDGGDDLAALGDPGAPETPQQQPDPAPAPEPEPQVEAQPDAPEQPAEPQPPQGYIPASRYREVASERKALKAQLEEATRTAQAMRAQLEAMQRGQPPMQPQGVQPQAVEKPDPEPDKSQNYVEWLEWKDRQHERRFREVESWKQEQAQVQRVQQERMQLAAAVVPQIEQYRQTAPDYDKALTFARDRLAQQVVTSGYNPMMAPQAIETFETQLAQFAMAWGVNPAALMHATAKAWGYGAQPDADGDDDAAPAAERPRDATGRFLPTQTAAAKPAPAPVKSLGNASGAAAAGQVTLEAWNKMNETQQAAALRKDPTIERRLLGG